MELLEGGVENKLILCVENVVCLYIKANMM
jgi:hypothetical protein